MGATQPRAVLDVGSNTIRLLVGFIEGGRVERVLDDSEFVRLGKDVDRTGELRGDRVDAAVAAIQRLSGEARERGVDDIVALATSAVRDAKNGSQFRQRVLDETGVDVRVISGDEEAELTYRGASIGIDLDGGTIVTDLGGGSAEIIFAGSEGVRWATSLPLGSGRLTERFVQTDPPEEAQLHALRQSVRTILGSQGEAPARTAVFTGGTATHVNILAGGAVPVAHLRPSDLEEVARLVAREPASYFVQERGFRPERAQVLPAGAHALLEIATYYAVADVVITQYGIREGALLSLGT